MQVDEFAVKIFPGIDGRAPKSGKHPLRVCIATEEIIGPVRNGGIASTYYHLAKGLASKGYEVHVLYLKGRQVENETPEHWIEHFATFGVTLHYLEMLEEPVWGAAEMWQKRYASAYRWFVKEKPFDVVHTSEWRGGLIYVLMAKQLGLAFDETLFIVKTSSPHIWNRHYQMQPIQKEDLATAAYAEQKCVELGDMVVGGSAHLLTFMDHIGYKLPRNRVYVQPNIVDFSEVKVTDSRPVKRKVGDIIKNKELTFFGRLESRKGLELFCNALDILDSRGLRPDKVNFLGKYGDALAKHGNIKVVDFLELKKKTWKFPVEIITDLNQPEALSFLCSRDMIAVMPSLIENSTMAVYEALENKLAFIATAVGGTPELVDESHHDQVLVEPTSASIADRLEQILKFGQIIPKASFSNAKNVEEWFNFHANVAAKIAKEGAKKAVASYAKAIKRRTRKIDKLALVCLVRGTEGLDDFANALAKDTPDEVVFVVTDAGMVPRIESACEKLTKSGVQAQLLPAIGMAAGSALNLAIGKTSSPGLIIADGVTVQLRPGFCQSVRDGLTAQPNFLLTTFFAAAENVVGMPIGGDIASQFLNARAFGPEFVAVTRSFQKRVGPFEPYDAQFGLVHGFITKAVEGGSDLLVVPEVLLTCSQALAEHSQRSADPVYKYLKIKPLIDDSSIALRKVLLTALSGGGSSVNPALFRERARSEDQDVWLVHADKNRFESSQFNAAKTLIGLDEENSRLLFLAVGNGNRSSVVNNVAIETNRLETLHAGTKNEVTLDEWPIPSVWLPGSQYGVKHNLEHAGKTRARYVRVMKLSDNVFSVTSGSAILSRVAIYELFESKRVLQRAKSGFRKSMENLSRSFGTDQNIDAANSSSDDWQQLTVSGQTKNLPAANTDFLLEAFEEKATGTDKDGLVPLAGLINIDWQVLPEKENSVRAATREQSIGDLIDGDSIEGWAWDRQDPTRILTIVALVDNKPVAAVRANHLNESLGRRTPGLENHGFRLPLPEKVMNNAERLELRVLETRQQVKNGVFNIHAGMLIPVSQKLVAGKPGRRGWFGFLRR